MGSQRECPKKLSGASSVLTASSSVSCLSLYTGMSKTRTTLGYWNCTVDKFVEASVLLLGGEKATGFCSSGRRKKLREVVRQHKEKPKKLTSEGMGAIPDVSRTSAIPHNSRVKFRFKHNNEVWVDRIPASIKYAIVDSSKFVSTFDGVYWDPPTLGRYEFNCPVTKAWKYGLELFCSVDSSKGMFGTAVREYKDFALSEYARVGRELTLYEITKHVWTKGLSSTKPVPKATHFEPLTKIAGSSASDWVQDRELYECIIEEHVRKGKGYATVVISLGDRHRGKLQLSTVLLVFQVRDVKWDAKFGVQNIELRLVEYFVDKFKKQVRNVFDVS
ncbi:1,4-alpha-glucan-branching enzyme-like protein isoform X1 [Tanacetum coccineum]